MEDVQVHASQGDWESAWQTLQNLGPTAQKLISEDIGSNHNTALLFQLFILQLQAGWKLGHAVGVEELYTFCKEIIFAVSETSSEVDWLPLLQFLVMKHVEQADAVLMDDCERGNTILAWKVLEQAEKCLQSDTADLMARASQRCLSCGLSMLHQVGSKLQTAAFRTDPYAIESMSE